MGFCEVCNKEVSRLDHHRPVHDPNLRFKCTFYECPKSYATKSRLEAHIRVAHTKEKPFICSFEGCTKSFATHSQRMMHNRTHSDVKNFECVICGKSFRTFAENYKHQFTHADLRFVCDVPGCNKTYNQPYSLNNHYKNSHPDFVRLNP